jgi:type 1 glutamine amidotransferase
MMNRRAFLTGGSAAVFAAPRDPLRLLILTGGHGFDEPEFFQVFRDMKDVRFTHVQFKKDAEGKLAPEAASEFDVMLFYDMHQDPQPHWDSWMALLDRGMPSVFLHHALGSYAKVPEYLDIVGGRARFTLKVFPGEISTFFSHDQDMRIHIADRNHPITAGLEDFTIRDECYRGFYVRPDAHILLTTDHPANNHDVAWTYRYRNSKTVYLQLGHDKAAYQNPNFGKLVARCIQWAASAGT